MFGNEILVLMTDCFKASGLVFSVLNTNLIGQASVCLKGSTVLSDILSELTIQHSRVGLFLLLLFTDKGIDCLFSTLNFITTAKNVPKRAVKLWIKSKKTVTHSE